MLRLAISGHALVLCIVFTCISLTCVQSISDSSRRVQTEFTLVASTDAARSPGISSERQCPSTINHLYIGSFRNVDPDNLDEETDGVCSFLSALLNCKSWWRVLVHFALQISTESLEYRPFMLR